MNNETDKKTQEAVKRAEANKSNPALTVERHRMRQKMQQDARALLVSHAVTEWTLVRSLAWAERIIIVVAVLLYAMDPARELLSFSGVGFIVVSLSFLGPVYGVMMFVSLLLVYKVLKKLKKYPVDVAGFKKVIYPTYAVWCPFIYLMSHYALNLYYEILRSVPVWDNLKAMWGHH